MNTINHYINACKFLFISKTHQVAGRIFSKNLKAAMLMKLILHREGFCFFYVRMMVSPFNHGFNYYAGKQPLYIICKYVLSSCDNPVVSLQVELFNCVLAHLVFHNFPGGIHRKFSNEVNVARGFVLCHV